MTPTHMGHGCRAPEVDAAADLFTHSSALPSLAQSRIFQERHRAHILTYCRTLRTDHGRDHFHHLLDPLDMVTPDTRPQVPLPSATLRYLDEVGLFVFSLT